MGIFGEIADQPPFVNLPENVIGRTREGRPLYGYTLGRGPLRASLIGGCHADEPVGPLLLSKLLSLLHAARDDHPLLSAYQWWIVPHANPDGAAVNEAWFSADSSIDLPAYLRLVRREAPGEDVEFCFPRGNDDEDARPENLSMYRWWSQAEGGFAMHASLHGMAFAGGPWLLIERAWASRSSGLQSAFAKAASGLGYVLHDVERNGEKGFSRLARGFCTRPDSSAMRQYFLERGDEATAALFRPSSMETIRCLSEDALTLVTEMPLFITPGVGEVTGPPDPVQQRWSERISGWKARLATGACDGEIRREACAAGLVPMPLKDQMKLQWAAIAAGIQTVQMSD